MIIGIPKEIKENEFRVALTPDGARLLKEAGHKVIVERSAGVGSGFPDEEYTEAGAELVDSPKNIFADADMVVKVKEPLKEEFPYLRKGLVVFTFLHLASNKVLTEALLKAKTTGVAYETVVTDD
ncbi:alanine dehydrogenase, partial [bacterium]|nr:alanine dehydrogenase [bacterium]